MCRAEVDKIVQFCRLASVNSEVIPILHKMTTMFTSWE
jgi:hypothetical protein